jgi:hypothetical protein
MEKHGILLLVMTHLASIRSEDHPTGYLAGEHNEPYAIGTSSFDLDLDMLLSAASAI